MSGNEYVTLDLQSLGTYDAAGRTDIVSDILVSAVSVEAGFRDLDLQPNPINLDYPGLKITDMLDPRSPTTTVSAATVYRLRGYFIGGATYEFWTGTSTTTPNPSGNPLVGVVIDAVIS